MAQAQLQKHCPLKSSQASSPVHCKKINEREDNSQGKPTWHIQLYPTLPDVVICGLADTAEMKILSKLCKSPGPLLLAGQETRALNLERVKDILEGGETSTSAWI